MFFFLRIRGGRGVDGWRRCCSTTREASTARQRPQHHRMTAGSLDPSYRRPCDARGPAFSRLHVSGGVLEEGAGPRPTSLPSLLVSRFFTFFFFVLNRTDGQTAGTAARDVTPAPNPCARLHDSLPALKKKKKENTKQTVPPCDTSERATIRPL